MPADTDPVRPLPAIVGESLHSSVEWLRLDPRVADLIRRLGSLTDAPLAGVREGDPEVTPELWLEALARLGARQVAERRLAAKVAVHLGLPRGAKDRILLYLQANLGVVVGKDELSGVSGIYEWARRVRELRVEDGWSISSATNRDDLRPGQYVLEAPRPDSGLKERWRTANRIRRSPGSARDRILEYLRENVGRPVAKDELQYVARIQEHPRRVRELVEAGWQIESNLDRPSLRSGEYLLVTEEMLPAKVRGYIKLRYQVMERDHWRCRMCSERGGRAARLQVHHVVTVAAGGDNDFGNLLTLCDACHGGVHSVAAGQAVDELLHPDAEPGA